MWRSLLTVILYMALIVDAAAFDLWDGAGLFGSSPKAYTAETKAYIARVQADGGTVIEPAAVDKAFRMMSANGISSDLAAGYSADFGVKKDGSGFVSKLYSLTGASSDLVQAVGGSQPQWVTAQQNGEPVLVFNGSSHSLKTASFTLNQPEHLFMAYKRTAWGPNGATLIDGNASNGMRIYDKTSSPALNMIAGVDFNIFSPPSIGSWHQISVLFSGASSEFRTDGVAQTGINAGTNAASGVTLGALGGGSFNSNMSFGELLIFKSAITTQKVAVESYLKGKWGTP